MIPWRVSSALSAASLTSSPAIRRSISPTSRMSNTHATSAATAISAKTIFSALRRPSSDS